jgi:hypothetical protein
VRPEGLGELKKLIHLIGSRARDVPVCSSPSIIRNITTRRLGWAERMGRMGGNGFIYIYIYIYIYIWGFGKTSRKKETIINT